MHDIEPHYNWQHLYIASEDERSPFFGREYSEFEFTHSIYNYVIHPQWDDMGSPTLFLKILFIDYDDGYVIIELFGEWNDCINNDIMTFKRDIIEKMIGYGINKFILIGDNVMNFHASDDSYYQEWFEEIEDGWITLINLREHVTKEFQSQNNDQYLYMGDMLNNINWRTYTPLQLFDFVKRKIGNRLS